MNNLENINSGGNDEATIRVIIYSDFISLDFVHVTDVNRLEPFAVTYGRGKYNL